ncbi:MAG: metal-dependent hydrolase [Nitrospirota bacterium]|jgi:inner membrane protein
MDPLTHTLSAVVVRNLGFRGRASLGVLVISSLAPDVDFLTRLLGAEAMLRYHRGITHGVLALLVVPLAMGFLYRKSKGGFLYFWFLATLGYGLHIALDLTNHHGTRLFAPLDWELYSADLTFLVDPYLAGALALSLLVAWLARERARAVALATMAVLVLYLGVKHHYHDKTEEFLRASLDEYVIEKVVPMPSGFMRWWFIARGDGEIKTGVADLFTRSVYVHKTYPAGGPDPAAERSKTASVVRNFIYFAKYPYPEVSASGGRRIVKWRDLSYGYAPPERFTATVVMDGQGRLVSSRLVF